VRLLQCNPRIFGIKGSIPQSRLISYPTYPSGHFLGFLKLLKFENNQYLYVLSFLIKLSNITSYE
jgi:hypothetical protein